MKPIKAILNLKAWYLLTFLIGWKHKGVLFIKQDGLNIIVLNPLWALPILPSRFDYCKSFADLPGSKLC